MYRHDRSRRQGVYSYNWDRTFVLLYFKRFCKFFSNEINASRAFAVRAALDNGLVYIYHSERWFLQWWHITRKWFGCYWSNMFRHQLIRRLSESLVMCSSVTGRWAWRRGCSRRLRFVVCVSSVASGWWIGWQRRCCASTVWRRGFWTGRTGTRPWVVFCPMQHRMMSFSARPTWPDVAISRCMPLPEAVDA